METPKMSWDPEDKEFWNKKGKKMAYRNLFISIPALMLGFCVWQLMSVVNVKLGDAGFNYSASQIATLIALPGLIGATLRLFYTFAPGLFGGKNWTVISTLLLLIPCFGLGAALQNPATSFGQMALWASLLGLGGGTFSSSMANIGVFFPKEIKGTALGMNGGIGNMGVSLIQFVAPLVLVGGMLGITIGEKHGGAYLQHVAYFWIPFIIIVAILAMFMMDNHPNVKQPFKNQLAVVTKKHNWILSVLYTCSFGSFIGFGAGFIFISKHIFPDSNFIQLAFVGPLLASLARWGGGWLADKFKGSRVTVMALICMTLATFGALYFTTTNLSFTGFFIMMLILFASAGVANGSIFQMITVVFPGKQSGPVSGFKAAIAAYGAFIIPKLFGWSFEKAGNSSLAFGILIAYYLISLALTIYFYFRKNAEVKC